MEINSANLISNDDLHRYKNIPSSVDFRAMIDQGQLFPVDTADVLALWYAHMGEENNSYDEMIYRSNFIKKHGLTPVFLSDITGTMMAVTSQENLDNKLN